MKFLLTTYSTAFAFSGGGESEMVQIAETLNQADHLADIYGSQSRPIEFYDVGMHFSIDANGWALFQLLGKKTRAVLLWPNVWWFERPSDIEVARVTLFVEIAKKLLFRSVTERDNFIQYINVPLDKTLILPICVSSHFLNTPNAGLAKTIVDFDEYVICLGRVEPVKNQLTLIKALNKLGIHGVMVGGSNSASYLEQCKTEGKANIAFLPFVKPCSTALISLLDGATIMAEPCFDPAGRSAFEAALLGKPLVLNRNRSNQEYFKSFFYGADPSSEDSIASCIKQAWRDDSDLARHAQRHVHLISMSDEAVDKFLQAVIDACD